MESRGPAHLAHMSVPARPFHLTRSAALQASQRFVGLRSLRAETECPEFGDATAMIFSFAARPGSDGLTFGERCNLEGSHSDPPHRVVRAAAVLPTPGRPVDCTARH